jgi:hypothetical protein
MKLSLRRIAATLCTAALIGALASTAGADTIGNNVDASVDATPEVLNLTVGAGNAAVGLFVNPTNGDLKNGCNLTGSTTLVVSVSSSNPAAATVAPSSITFDSCGATPSITVHPVAAGTSTISLTETSNNTTGTFDLTPATFTAQVAAAPVTDADAPTWSCSAADTIWHATNQSVSCTASDASGLKAGSPASFTLSTSVAVNTEDANASTGTQSLCDIHDNCTTAGPVSGWMIDRKAPTISCGTAPTDWSMTDVTINCTASDGGSGLATATDATFSLSTNVAGGTETSNASTDSKSVSDGVGNSSTAGPISGIQVDKKAPTVNCDQAPGSWSGSDVMIQCTASDAGSGLADQDDASFMLSTNVSSGTETDSASTDSRDVYDIAGNMTTAGAVTGVKVDKKAPSISCGTPSAAWSAGDITVSCTAADAGSGLDDANDASFTLSTNVAAGSETSTATIAKKTVCDDVNNCADAGPFTGLRVDKRAPSVSCLPATADSVWHDDNVDVDCTGTDGGSGVTGTGVTLWTSVVAGSFDGNASTDSNQICDAVNNCAPAGPVTGWKIDREDPHDFTWTGGPAAGATYVFGSVPAAPTCGAVDNGSGLDSNGCVVTGYSSAVGSHTMTATATDLAGNVSTDTVSYTVNAWTLRGFYQPVDMTPPGGGTIVWNTVKNGSTAPLKFEVFAGTTELTDATIGNVVTALRKVYQVECSSGTDDSVEVAATGGTTLRYDTSAGQYIYNWQTPKKPNFCYSVTVDTLDGSAITAYFKLK